MNLLKCVSFFIDIGRGSWTDMGPNVQITNTQYIKNFLNFYSNVQVDLILFIEKSFEEEFATELESFKQTHNFYSKINLQFFDRKDIVFFQEPLYSSLVKAHYSEEFNTYKNNSMTEWIKEKAKPDYNIVMLCKPYMLRMARDRGLLEQASNNVVGWIDFGIAHSKPSYISCVSNKKLIAPETEKIIFFKRQHLDLSTELNYYQNLMKNGIEDVIIPGGFYVVPLSLIDLLCEEFLDLAKNKFLASNIIDDDQTFMAIFAKKKEQIMHLQDSTQFKNNPEEGDWFPVFNYLQEL